MAQVNFGAYTKKELIAMIEKSMNDNDVAILSTGLITMETKPRKQASFLSFQFPHEMLNEPDDIRGLVEGNVTSSIIIMRNPKKSVSKEYLTQLKKNDGVYGFTIQR